LDATRLPFRDSSLSNIIGIDALHHLPDPVAFLQEAQRCLKPSGRLLLIEPYLTPVSRVCWRLHREAIDESVDLFYAPANDRDEPKSPYEANQAIPTILFRDQLSRCQDEVPRLRLVTRRPFSFLAYPLSLGFQPWQLIPTVLLPVVKVLERPLERWAEWCAFRIFIVMEREGSHA
jgi:SAM-dependent methyltransferase